MVFGILFAALAEFARELISGRTHQSRIGCGPSSGLSEWAASGNDSGEGVDGGDEGSEYECV